MRKIFAVSLVVILALSLASPAYCDDALKKFSRGICNVFTCPLELAEQVKRTNQTDGPMASLTWGVLKGAGMIVVRGLVGVYEILTFPIPCPNDYGPVLKDPEFFFEHTIW